MSKSFAKLFDTDRGQILVILDEGRDGPEIAVKFKPEGLGVCTSTVQFSSWDNAQEAFDNIDKEIELATSWVKGLIDRLANNIPVYAGEKV